MGKQMDPLSGDGSMTMDNTGTGSTTISIPNTKMIMHQNLLFDRNEIKWYDHFNRYGCIDLYDTDQVIKEVLFFTKPDLYIYDGDKLDNNNMLSPSLKKIPFFTDAAKRHPKALAQLQYGIKDENGYQSPFMALLSNAVTSKMDLPTIQTEFNQSTPNIYATAIDYRSHSIKSDNSYDFTLSFMDTAYLEIYTMVKAYDEYMRMQKIGDIDFGESRYKDYITDRIINDQFSVYKFLVGSDGETILYYAKATGVFFTDVPRADFGDPGNDGFKFSLNFHANFIEDNNPLILREFNAISPANPTIQEPIDVYNAQGVNNSWARYPYIGIYGDKRAQRTGERKGAGARDYRLKWVEPDSPYDDNAFANSVQSYGGGRSYLGGSGVSAASRGGFVQDGHGVRYNTGGYVTVSGGTTLKSGKGGTSSSKPNPTQYINNPNAYNAGLRVNSSGTKAGNLLYEWVNGAIGNKMTIDTGQVYTDTFVHKNTFTY